MTDLTEGLTMFWKTMAFVTCWLESRYVPPSQHCFTITVLKLRRSVKIKVEEVALTCNLQTSV